MNKHLSFTVRTVRRGTHHCVRHPQGLCLSRMWVDVPLQPTKPPSAQSTDLAYGTTSRTKPTPTLYTSYVNTEETAISSAEAAEVTAKNSRTKRAAAPAFPRRAEAAAAAGRPAETSAAERTGMSGSFLRATAARPCLS